ncbi:MAG: type IV toxin-antitoxin system AbiEi family antitoxin [Dermabacter sp.]|nr:type IV toxin-antitoxin system AbiEi family antitoxin [Dermabacter sp.]
MDERLAQDFAELLDEFGLRISGAIDLTELPDQATAQVRLTHEHGRADYRVGYAETLTVSGTDWAQVHDDGNERLLLLGPRVTERSAEMFRRLGINYLDAAGNASIGFDGVHIDVRGRHRARGPVGARPPRLTRGGVNLFSAKRSQVIFTVLSWPDILDSPVRDIARVAGVSLGQAQQTLDLLTQYEFVDHRRRLLGPGRDRLIDQWAAAFPTSLGAASKTRRFSGKVTIAEPTGAAVYVSGEAGVPNLLRPETAVLYAAEFPTELFRQQRWRRDEEQPNIFFRHQFWQPPGESTPPGAHQAPWLLIYADLLAAHDSRQREAAQQLREEKG